MDQALLLGKVILFFQLPPYKGNGFTVQKIAALGDGAIAVIDSQGECDIYFSTSDWKMNPETAAACEAGRVEQPGNGIGYIPGLPLFKTFEQALEVARNSFVSMGGDQLYAEPRQLVG